jgi:hypothetical protein
MVRGEFLGSNVNKSGVAPAELLRELVVIREW